MLHVLNLAFILYLTYKNIHLIKCGIFQYNCTYLAEISSQCSQHSVSVWCRMKQNISTQG